MFSQSNRKLSESLMIRLQELWQFKAKLLRDVHFTHTLQNIFCERWLQKDFFLQQRKIVIFYFLHQRGVAYFKGFTFFISFLNFSLIDKHIGVTFVMCRPLPLPRVNSSVIELDPLAIALDDGVVVTSL